MSGGQQQVVVMETERIVTRLTSTVCVFGLGGGPLCVCVCEWGGV